MIKCPTTDKYVPTGMAMDRESYESASFEGNRLTCPECGETHTWGKRDTYLIEDQPRSRSD